MLSVFRCPKRLRVISSITAALFFYVTLFLSVSLDGSLGVQSAHAWAPPPIKKDKNLPAVYVVPFQRVGDYVSGSAVRRVDEYYRTLVDMNSGLRMIRSSVKKAEPTQPKVTKKPMRQDRDLEAADKAVWKGKEALQKRKWAVAASNFIRAAKFYNRKLALLEDFDKFVEAQLFIALSRFAQGYEADAEEALARVVTLRPELIVDKRWRSPEFETSIKRLKSGLARIPTGTIQINCPVAGCTIYVDGVVKGVNSASVTGLPRGNHVVRVTSVGYKPWAKRVFTPGKNQTRKVAARLNKERVRRTAKRAIKKGNPRTITPGLLADYVSEGQFNARFRMNAMRFCAQAGVDHLVMGVLNRVGNQYVVASYLYSVAKQQVAEVGQTLIAMDLSDLQVRLLSYEEQVAAAIKTFPRTKRVRRKPAVYAKWTPPPIPKAKPKKAKPVASRVATVTASAAVATSPKVENKRFTKPAKQNKATKSSKRIRAFRGILGVEKTVGTSANNQPENLSKYANPKALPVKKVPVKKKSVSTVAAIPGPIPAVSKKSPKRSWRRPKRVRQRTAWTTAKRTVQAKKTLPIVGTVSVVSPKTAAVSPGYQPQQPAYSQPSYQPQQPAYSQPSYQPQQPAYGQPSVQPQQPVYQPQQPAYSQPSVQPQQPAYGQPSYQPQQPAYGQPSYQPQQPAYGQPSVQPQQPAYGQQPLVRPTYNASAQNAVNARPMVRRSTPFTVMARAPGQAQPGQVIPMTGVAQPAVIGDPWYTKWWVWTIVGTVVVGGAVAAGILLAPPPSSGAEGWNAAVSW